MATGCTGCGAEQRIGDLPAGAAAYCRRCDTPLERPATKGLIRRTNVHWVSHEIDH